MNKILRKPKNTTVSAVLIWVVAKWLHMVRDCLNKSDFMDMGEGVKAAAVVGRWKKTPR